MHPQLQYGIQIGEEARTLKHRNRKNYNQYFTPEFAVEKAFSLIPFSQFKNIIDPAVGNGVFIKIASQKWRNAKLFGVDIDSSVVQDLKKYSVNNFFCFIGNSLLKETWDIIEIKNIITNGGFDLVMGNPPFSSWFQRISNHKILSNYLFSYKNGKLMKSQAIEVLFIEVFIKLTRDGGYIVIVLPDGILSNPQYRYIREYILKTTKIKHIINLHRYAFDNTSAKTSILILEKKKVISINYTSKIHNLEKNGNINNIIEVKAEDLINRMDYSYYYNLPKNSLKNLIKGELNFAPLKDFVIYCKTGKTVYGKERKFSERGLRFLHATNITDIGINYKKDENFIDPASKMNFPSAYVKMGDILFVRVGVGCAGRVAIVDTKDDEGIATDYIHMFRVKNINPYFIVIYLKTRFGKDSINLLKHGVGTVSINKTELLSIMIPIVSQELQNEVENKYKLIIEKYHQNMTSPDIKKEMDSLIIFLEMSLMNINNGGTYVEMRDV